MSAEVALQKAEDINERLAALNAELRAIRTGPNPQHPVNRARFFELLEAFDAESAESKRLLEELEHGTTNQANPPTD